MLSNISISKKRLFLLLIFVVFILLGYIDESYICADTLPITAKITNFKFEEFKDTVGIEITAQVINCLNDAKVIANVKNKKKGIIKKIFTKNIIIDDSIELQRIYYDDKDLVAVFSGILPYKLKEVDIVLEVSNFAKSDMLERIKEEPIVIPTPVVVIEDTPVEIVKPIIVPKLIKEDTSALARLEEEERLNAINEEVGRNILHSAKKRQEAIRAQEQSDYETVIGVVVLLPLLLEFAGGLVKENEVEIEQENQTFET